MKYSTDEALDEILRRSENIERKRVKRSMHALSSAAGGLMAALIIVIAVLSESGTAGMEESTMGSFMLSAKAGGYIIVAVLAFIAGAILTMATQRYRQSRAGQAGNDRSADDSRPAE